MERERILTVTAKDCRWHFFGASSKGGQNANRNKCYARCIHSASGAVGEGKVFKSQRQNKKLAFKNMAESKKFRDWVRRESWRKIGVLDQIEKHIDSEMKKVKVEVKDSDGRWSDWEDLTPS